MKKAVSFLRNFYVLIDLYKVDLSVQGDFPEIKQEGFTFGILEKKADKELFDSIILERGSKFNKIVDERLDSGNFIGFYFSENKTGKTAYIRWLRNGSFYHEKYKKNIKMTENEAFTLDSYTLDEFRGIGLHKEMNIRMLNYCKNELNLVYIYMVIFRGKDYKYLHNIVLKLGYKRINSNFYFTLRPLILVANKLRGSKGKDS